MDRTTPGLWRRRLSGMLPEYNIQQQSTKVAIDRDGVIVFREGFGVEPAETWHELFRELSQA